MPRLGLLLQDLALRQPLECAVEQAGSLKWKRLLRKMLSWAPATKLSGVFSSRTMFRKVRSTAADVATSSADHLHLAVHLELLLFLRIVFWWMFCSWDWSLVTSILGSTMVRTRTANRHGRACASSHSRRERHGSARAAIGP